MAFHKIDHGVLDHMFRDFLKLSILRQRWRSRNEIPCDVHPQRMASGAFVSEIRVSTASNNGSIHTILNTSYARAHEQHMGPSLHHKRSDFTLDASTITRNGKRDIDKAGLHWSDWQHVAGVKKPTKKRPSKSSAQSKSKAQLKVHSQTKSDMMREKKLMFSCEHCPRSFGTKRSRASHTQVRTNVLFAMGPPSSIAARFRTMRYLELTFWFFTSSSNRFIRYLRGESHMLVPLARLPLDITITSYCITLWCITIIPRMWSLKKFKTCLACECVNKEQFLHNYSQSVFSTPGARNSNGHGS